MIRLTDIAGRKTLAVQLGERTGQDIHYSEVLADGEYVYRHNAEYPTKLRCTHYRYVRVPRLRTMLRMTSHRS